MSIEAFADIARTIPPSDIVTIFFAALAVASIKVISTSVSMTANWSQQVEAQMRAKQEKLLGSRHSEAE